jgi:hypothetical protein
MIQRAAGQMNRLIQDLLEVAGMEAGNISVEPQEEPVDRLLRSACRTMQHGGECEADRAVCEHRGRLPPVHADRDRIDQVLGNLIGNAVKFTPREGEVRVGAERTASGCGSRWRIPASASTRPTCRTCSTASGRRSARATAVRGWARHRPGHRRRARRGDVGGERAGRGSTFFFTLPSDGLGAGHEVDDLVGDERGAPEMRDPAVADVDLPDDTGADGLRRLDNQLTAAAERRGHHRELRRQRSRRGVAAS